MRNWLKILAGGVGVIAIMTVLELIGAHAATAVHPGPDPDKSATVTTVQPTDTRSFMIGQNLLSGCH